MANFRILVVDDEAKMRRILEIMLTQMGYEVEQASDGLQALEIISTQVVDLVITDLQMPNLDGMGLLRSISEQSYDIPVILVTAHATIETAVDAMKYGASDYIVRPFELKVVESAVQRAFNLDKLQRQNRYLRHELAEDWNGFIGTSLAMQEVYTAIKQVAPMPTSVLIQGDTGTGKELVAHAIHNASSRTESLFVSLNCAAIPADILEAELFGFNKGSFTGANKDRVGKFELADGGTLFLDEITEMDINLQAKLLRVLQERTFERIGSNRSISVDIRIIASTNRNPKQAIAEQRLREDLFYRLNVFTITLPPLQGRQDDIVPLARYFINKHALTFGYKSVDLEEEVVQCLLQHTWPGNVRELENMMERAVVLSNGKSITLAHLPSDIRKPPAIDSNSNIDDLSLNSHVEQLEKELIQEALTKTSDNKAKAAQLLDISERALWYKIKKYFP